jgi:hypothetical protein
MGPRMRQMLATLCVASSFTLVALGGSVPTGGFHLGTLSVAGPSTIMGPILDTVVVSHDVEGTSCEELGGTQTHVYCTFLQCLQGPAALHPLLLHHGAIKLVVGPARNLRPLA